MKSSSPQGLEPEEIPHVEVLDVDECWSLVAKATIGRIGLRTEHSVDIFPVNFTVKDRAVFIRSAPGSKLVDIARDPAVAFEVDGSDGSTHWSVVIKGRAERLSFDSDIQDSAVLDLQTMTSSAKWNYVRISASEITGRAFSPA